MNNLEDQLRDAFRAAADTVREDKVLANSQYLTRRPKRVRLPGFTRGTRGARPGRHRGWMQPVAAAVAVVAVATMSLLVPHLLPSPGQGQAQGHTGSGTPPAASGSAAPALPNSTALGPLGPKFMVLVGVDAPLARIQAAATGTVTGTVPVPRGSKNWVAAAAVGNGSTFVLAAEDGNQGGTRFYRLSLTADGKEASLTRLKAPTIPGYPNTGITPYQPLAVSANGHLVAFATLINNSHGPVSQQIVAFNVVTGTTRRWTAPDLPHIAGLSLSANGTQLAFTRCGASKCSEWQLPTDASSAPVFARAVTALPMGKGWDPHVVSDVLSADGQTVFAVSGGFTSKKSSTIVDELAAYSIATNRKTRVLMTKKLDHTPLESTHLLGFLLTADPDGSRLLFWPGVGGRGTVLNPAGHVLGTVKMPFPAYEINSVAW